MMINEVANIQLDSTGNRPNLVFVLKRVSIRPLHLRIYSVSYNSTIIRPRREPELPSTLCRAAGRNRIKKETFKMMAQVIVTITEGWFVKTTTKEEANQMKVHA